MMPAKLIQAPFWNAVLIFHARQKSMWVARGDKGPDMFTATASSPVIHRDYIYDGTTSH